MVNLLAQGHKYAAHSGFYPGLADSTVYALNHYTILSFQPRSGSVRSSEVTFSSSVDKMAEPLGVTCYSASSWRCHQTVSGLPIPGAKRNEGDVEGSICTG